MLSKTQAVSEIQRVSLYDDSIINDLYYMTVMSYK